MRRLEVRYREEALSDLDDIFERVLERSLSFDIAETFTERIKARCDRIGNTPYGGVARDDLEPGLRLVGFERRAVILYKVEADCIRVANIFYGGKDYEALYRGRSDD